MGHPEANETVVPPKVDSTIHDVATVVDMYSARGSLL